MIKWLDTRAVDEDVVVSSRIRLARNLEEHTFPLKASIGESEEITDLVLNSLKDGIEDKYKFTRMHDIDENTRLRNVENHLISLKLANNLDGGSFLLRDDDRVSIMINEEDHIRLQVLSRGLNFDENWNIINDLDNKLDKNIDYAFDKKWGYLTACPTNVGTGLRVSSMLHLPCLTKTGNMPSLIDGLRKIGVTTRGVYGEGSKHLGDMYQISNQKTLGESEEETIRKMEKIIEQIIYRERQTRNYLYENNLLEVEDVIYRAIGTLKYARKLEISEAMEFLSRIRVGYAMSILEVDYTGILDLMMKIQPSNMEYILENEYKDENISVGELRARIVSDYVDKMEG